MEYYEDPQPPEPSSPPAPPEDEYELDPENLEKIYATSDSLDYYHSLNNIATEHGEIRADHEHPNLKYLKDAFSAMDYNRDQNYISATICNILLEMEIGEKLYIPLRETIYEIERRREDFVGKPFFEFELNYENVEVFDAILRDNSFYKAFGLVPAIRFIGIIDMVNHIIKKTCPNIDTEENPSGRSKRRKSRKQKKVKRSKPRTRRRRR